MAVSSPTNINLNDLQPPPKPDSSNVEVQAGPARPDPNSPGSYLRDVSFCYRYPTVGGVFVITADYDISGTDSGFTLICNSASGITLTLPAVAPFFTYPAQGLWFVRIKNFGTGDVAIAPNGLQLDGSTSTVVLVQNSGFEISTDGTNYWTYGNFGVGGAVSAPISAVFADAEVPSGTIDGVNDTFTLVNSPVPAVSLDLYLDGQLLIETTDYTLSSNTITMTSAPPSGHILLAFYRYGSASGSTFADNETPSGTINGSNTAFALLSAPNPPSSLELFLDGMMLKAGTDFTLSGNAITMLSAPPSGHVLIASYRYVASASYNFAGEESPAGTINGSNTTFTLANSPSPVASLRLYVDGLLMKSGLDYTLSGATITMTSAPATGETLYAFYRY